MTAADLRTFPMRRSSTRPLDPPPEYAALRADEPVTKVRIFDGTEIWLVTRHEDVQTVLTDPRMSADPHKPGFPDVRRSGRALLEVQHPNFFRMDSPEHLRQRRMVVPHFTPQKVRQLKPEIQRLVDGVVDDLLATETRPVDLVTALALPIPSLVICALLGVPYEDHEFFQHHSKHDVSPTMSPEEAVQSQAEIQRYMDGVVRSKQQNPGEDFLSHLVVERLNRGELDHQTVVSIAILMLNAGHLTTATMISLGTLTLLEHPEQLAELRADPELVPGAVEELLRWLTIVQLVTARAATADIEIGGQLIRAGEGVFALTPSANRDERWFPDPDSFDIHRQAHGHHAFGDGPHFCIGHSLARLELDIVFRTLLRRVPTLRLAVPVSELSFTDDEALYRVERLPVTW